MAINFLDPDVFKGVKTDCYNAAKDGQKIDYSSFPAAEYKYFTELYKICSMFFKEKISQEELINREKELKKQYETDLDCYLRYNELFKNHRSAISASSELCTALCKNPMKLPAEVNTALKSCLDIISAMGGESADKITIFQEWRSNS